MSIGTGLALLGVWGFAAACALSREVTGAAMAIAFFIALIATVILA